MAKGREKFFTTARQRMKLAHEADSAQRKQEQDDLRFQIPELQWSDDVRAARGAGSVMGVPVPGRPMLSVAPVDEPIQLVANQARAAHLACSFHPLSADANDDTAEVLQGLYTHDANDSRANTARMWAYDRALWCGRGVYRLDKVYDPDGGHPFDQKIIWRRLLYQDAYYRDPSAQEPDRSDALWAFVVEALPGERYQSKYPKSKLAKFTNEGIGDLKTQYGEWFGGDDEDTRTIKVAEYWRVQVETITWVLCDDGQVYRRDEIPDGVNEIDGDEARSRDEDIRRVFWSKINYNEELEPEQEWDGQYIPLIEVIGRELIPFDGKRRWAGMMTNAKDSARLVNYGASGAAEMAALEPKAPYTLDPRQIEGYKEFWQQANYRNFPYLPYNATIDGQAVPAPERTQVDVSRLGPNLQILSMGGNMLQASMSTFDPALGKQPTAHRSGRALEALQGQTVEANSHYLSNLADVSLMYEAKVWLDLAPHVYDRPERVVRILKGEGSTELVMLGMPFTRDAKGQPQATPTGEPVPSNALHFDLAKGRYGIATTVGKSSASRLQQGNDALTAVIQAEPALLPLVGPLWAKTLDFPLHNELAELLTKNRDHMMPWLRPADGQQDPASLAAENQALKQQLQQAMQAIQTEQAKIQAQTQGKLQVTALQEGAESDRADKDREAKLAVAALQGKFETLQNAMQLLQTEIARIGSQQHELSTQNADHAHDVAMAAMDHGSAIDQADQQHQQVIQQAEQANDHAQQQTAQEAALQPPPEAGNG